MRPFTKITLAIAFLILSIPTLASAADQEPQAVKDVARVGSMIINQTDVDLRAQKILPMQVSFHGSLDAEKIAEIKQKALDELITRAYKIQYAISEEISVDATSVETEWQKILSKNPKLTEYRHTPQVAKIKADLYLDLLSRKAEQVAVDGKITVSDQDVADYYQNNKEKYFRPKLYTASHIFIKVDPSENAEEKAEKKIRAEALYEKAQSGVDFYNLAYYESDDRSKYVGGSLGSFHAGQTVAEFDQAIQTMKPGEIVGPIRTMYGFHIIKLDDVEEERQMEFDEVSAKIRASLEDSQREKLYQQWMASLKDQFKLELLN